MLKTSRSKSIHPSILDYFAPPRYIPWWLACNPQRFPYWFGQPDPRNKELVAEFSSKLS